MRQSQLLYTIFLQRAAASPPPQLPRALLLRRPVLRKPPTRWRVGEVEGNDLRGTRRCPLCPRKTRRQLVTIAAVVGG